ncbi:MAG: glycosyl hydrolase [Phycisphaera sp.]|nr:glycosyl hydrolase [Phycisphaera sp.]
MIDIDSTLTPRSLLSKIDRLWRLSGERIRAIAAASKPGDPSPVFTVKGRYTAKGWTEWTQGFEYGSALLQFDATGDAEMLDFGRRMTLERMAPHVTHFGVHDHGFNNVSTYGTLWRLAREGRTDDAAEGTLSVCEMALRASAAVQASRWSKTHEGGGYVYSFNGPQSLFIDTVRSMRVLAIGHQLGHRVLGEADEPIDLLRRLIEHARTTATYNVFYGEGRDAYDVWGRVAHESIFNPNDGRFRCPSSQQGYSPFTTWTRGLAWAMLGFAELLEFVATVEDDTLAAHGGRTEIETMMQRAARATCDFYINHSPVDGVPYWDAGAPGLVFLGEYLDQPADPFNDFEPVDSSAAAIAAQGLVRLGHYLEAHGAGEADADAARRYTAAGLTVLNNLFEEPYLVDDDDHQGLIWHSVYHRPNGWDYIPDGQKAPCGESSMWGDYHAREVALLVQRMAKGEPYYTFFGPVR